MKIRNIIIALAAALLSALPSLAQGSADDREVKQKQQVSTLPSHAQGSADDREAKKSADSDYMDAVQLYADGDYSGAAALLKKVLARDPGNDGAWYYMGMSALYRGDKEAALASLDKAASLDTANYWYRDRLAMAYARSGEMDKSIAEYERLARLYPKKMDSFYTLTNLYLAKGEYGKAVGAIDDIEAFYGKSDATVLTKYRIFLQEQKQEEALKTLKDYSDEYASPQILSMLGDHEAGMSNDSLACAYYDEALALDSGYSPALLGKAEVYRIARKYPEYFSAVRGIMSSESVSAAEKADYVNQVTRHVDPNFIQAHRAQLDSVYVLMQDRHPADTAVLQVSGVYYFNTGRPEMAREVLRKNMESNPDNVRAAYMYLEVLSETKDYETLVSESEKASVRFPGDKTFDSMALFGEYSLKHYERVIVKCESMIAKAPADSATCLDAYSTMGDIYHLMGESAKAYKAYDKALKINPRYAPVLNNYAYYLSLEGKSLSKAYRMSKTTIEIEPDNATYLDTFGWILHLQGKDLEAKPFFKHAMLYGGKESSTMLAHYAIVLEALGETDLANVYKTQAKARAEQEEKEEK